MAELPVILTVFAEANEYGHLGKLEEEHAAIQKVFVRIPSLRHVSFTGVKRAQLVENLEYFERELCIFHFGGHADGQQLHFKDGAGQLKGLAQLLKSSSKIKLIFLNGCDTHAHAISYLEVGIPAVIATTCSVPDGLAKQFAERFYTSFSRARSLEEAFKIAKSEAMLNGMNSGEQDIVVLRGPIKANIIKDDSPWKLYVNDPQMLNWRLPELKDSPAERKEILNWITRWAISMVGFTLTLILTALSIDANPGLSNNSTVQDIFIALPPIVYLIVPLAASFDGKLSIKRSKILNGMHFIIYGMVLLSWKLNRPEYPPWLFISMLVLAFLQWHFIIPLLSKNKPNASRN